MSFRTERFNDEKLDNLFKILLEGLEKNTRLNEKRRIVNSILPVQKYKLLERFLSDDEDLSQDICLKCLPIFLDENTKYLGFEREIFTQTIIKSILELIPKYCPNIETVDFRKVWIEPENKVNFKTFLKKNTKFKSLRVKCSSNNCAIRELLFEEDFHLLEQDVQNGLLKIEYIDAFELFGTQCEKLLKLLPNLRSFGIYQELSVVLPFINKEIQEKLCGITEFLDKHTSLDSFVCFSKCCPNATKISLWYPEDDVIENLCKFPLLTELQLYLNDPYYVTEIISVLKRIGKQIKILKLQFPGLMELGPNIFQELCPELVRLDINYETFYFY